MRVRILKKQHDLKPVLNGIELRFQQCGKIVRVGLWLVLSPSQDQDRTVHTQRDRERAVTSFAIITEGNMM